MLYVHTNHVNAKNDYLEEQPVGLNKREGGSKNKYCRLVKERPIAVGVGVTAAVIGGGYLVFLSDVASGAFNILSNYVSSFFAPIPVTPIGSALEKAPSSSDMSKSRQSEKDRNNIREKPKTVEEILNEEFEGEINRKKEYIAELERNAQEVRQRAEAYARDIKEKEYAGVAKEIKKQMDAEMLKVMMKGADQAEASAREGKLRTERTIELLTEDFKMRRIEREKAGLVAPSFPFESFIKGSSDLDRILDPGLNPLDCFHAQIMFTRPSDSDLFSYCSEIGARWRDLARVFHPDQNIGAITAIAKLALALDRTEQAKNTLERMCLDPINSLCTRSLK